MQTTLNPSIDAITTSLSIVYSAQSKKPVPREQITELTRVNEQELYSALVHRRLEKEKPELATRYAAELKAAADTYRTGHPDDLNMFKVSDRLMRQYVRESKLSQADYRSIRDDAFGRAQLDSDRTRLSAVKSEGSKDGDTPLRAVSTAVKKIETNEAATSGEIAQFRAHEAEISRAKFKDRKAGSVLQPGTAVSTISGAAPAGFLWKPVSEKNGNLVVLLPPELTGRAAGVTVHSPDGNSVLARGSYSGIGNGAREHYRFGKPGGSFPDGAVVTISLAGGEQLRIAVPKSGSELRGLGD